MNGLLKHLKEHKCYHHIIVRKYFTFYLRLKDKQSFLSNQLKDIAKHNKKCYYSKNMISLQNNNVKNVTQYNMKYLLNTSYHHHEILRHIASMFTVIETKLDWSSGYSGILYCLKTERQRDDIYTMFQLRRDMRNKFDDNVFMKIFKASLKLLNIDVNFCKKY